MGVVKYATGIEYVKGSLAKPKKQNGHNHGDYLIGTHREAATQNPDCTRLYIRKSDVYKRSTLPTAKELQARSRFTEVSRAVKLRAKDLMQITSDQQAFLAQRDTAGGKKTMRAYLWYVCGQEYDTQHGTNSGN
jgi:hypothetical protein